MSRNFLIVDPEDGIDVLKAFASPARISILKLLHDSGALNVNEIAQRLDLPQSSVSSNIQVLEDAGLIRTTHSKTMGTINAANLRAAHAAVESNRTIGTVVLEGF